MKSIGWSSAGTLIEFGTGIVTLIVLGRLIGPAAFGVVTLSLAITTLLRRVTTVSVGQALVFYTGSSEERQANCFVLCSLLSLATALLVLTSAPFLARIFAIPGMANPLRLLSVTIFLKGISQVAESLLQSKLRFRRLAVAQSTAGFVGYGVVGIALAVQGYGVWALVFASLTQAAFEAVLLLAMQPHKMIVRPRIGELRVLLRYAWRLSIGDVANSLALQGDNMVVAKFLGPSSLGLYSRAYRLMAFPANVFGDAVGTVLFPAMAQAKGSVDQLGRAMLRGTSMLGITVIPASVLAVVMADEVILVVLGHAWMGAVPALRVLAIGMFFRVAFKIGGAVLKATSRVRALSFILILYAVLVIGGAMFGQRWGIAGVSCGAVGALTVCFLSTSIVACRGLGIPLRAFLRVLAPGIGAGATLGAVSIALNLIMESWHWGAGARLAVAITVGCLVIAAWAIFPNERVVGAEVVWWRSRALSLLSHTENVA